MTLCPPLSAWALGTLLALPVVIGAFELVIRLSLYAGVMGVGRALSGFETVARTLVSILALPAFPTLATVAEAFPHPWGLIAGALPGALFWGWAGALAFAAVRTRVRGYR